MEKVKGVTVLKGGAVWVKTGNQRCHDITEEEVRSCRQFEKCGEKDVQQIIKTIKRFALIAYDCYQKAKARQDQDATIKFK